MTFRGIPCPKEPLKPSAIPPVTSPSLPEQIIRVTVNSCRPTSQERISPLLRADQLTNGQHPLWQSEQLETILKAIPDLNALWNRIWRTRDLHIPSADGKDPQRPQNLSMELPKSSSKLKGSRYRGQQLDVLLLNEPWVTRTGIYIRECHVIRKDREHRAGGGTTIFASKHPKYGKGPALYNCDRHSELCKVTFHLVYGKLLLLTGYRPLDERIKDNKWFWFLNQFHDSSPAWKGINSFAP